MMPKILREIAHKLWFQDQSWHVIDWLIHTGGNNAQEQEVK